MPGAGKTVVGRELAGRLGVPFVDLDAEIEREAGRQRRGDLRRRRRGRVPRAGGGGAGEGRRARPGRGLVRRRRRARSRRTASRFATPASRCTWTCRSTSCSERVRPGAGPAADPRGGRPRAPAGGARAALPGVRRPRRRRQRARPARSPTRSWRSFVGPRDRRRSRAGLRRGRRAGRDRDGGPHLRELPGGRARLRGGRSRRWPTGGSSGSPTGCAARGLAARAAHRAGRRGGEDAATSTGRCCTSWRPRRRIATTSWWRWAAERWATWPGSSPRPTCGACRSCRCRRRSWRRSTPRSVARRP